MEVDKKIFLVAQRMPGQDDPGIDDIYQIGTVSTILQLLKLPDGTVKVLVEGVGRAERSSHIQKSMTASARALSRCRKLERVSARQK